MFSENRLKEISYESVDPKGTRFRAVSKTPRLDPTNDAFLSFCVQFLVGL